MLIRVPAAFKAAGTVLRPLAVKFQPFPKNNAKSVKIVIDFSENFVYNMCTKSDFVRFSQGFAWNACRQSLRNRIL
jgi:hypothetical protein